MSVPFLIVDTKLQDGKLLSLEGKQELANAGVMYLCGIVNGRKMKMPDSLHEQFKIAGNSASCLMGLKELADSVPSRNNLLTDGNVQEDFDKKPRTFSRMASSKCWSVSLFSLGGLVQEVRVYKINLLDYALHMIRLETVSLSYLTLEIHGMLCLLKSGYITSIWYWVLFLSVTCINACNNFHGSLSSKVIYCWLDTKALPWIINQELIDNGFVRANFFVVIFIVLFKKLF